MSYTGAEPIMVIIDDVHATRLLGQHRYLEMLEQLKSKNFTPVVAGDFHEDGGTSRDGTMMNVLNGLYGAHMEFPEELKVKEEKSNKPYWRTKERW